MPIYEYMCNQCGHELEEMQKFSEPHLTDCPECDTASLVRKPSLGAFHLKGSGWYSDHYGLAKNKNSENTTTTSNDSSSNSTTKSESKDTKPASKDTKVASTSTAAAA